MRHTAWRRPAALLALVTVLSACAPPRTEVALAIPVNELCTTCDDFVRCEATGATDGAYLLLHLENKRFGAQIATILDFLLQYVRERKQDLRPLAIYSSAGGPPHTGDDAVTDLERHRITVSDGWIDQANGAWYGADDALKGQCRLLPLAEGRQLVKQLQTAAQ